MGRNTNFSPIVVPRDNGLCYSCQRHLVLVFFLKQSCRGRHGALYIDLRVTIFFAGSIESASRVKNSFKDLLKNWGRKPRTE